uniref:Uncharacterized protein n=1 Tax=Oryza barthii TaxID=65489 RepID=A0A0D3GZ31_9ORYZ
MVGDHHQSTTMSEETSREGLRDGCSTRMPGDAAARLEVNEEDPERLMMTSADNEIVNARTVMNTTKAAKLWSKGTTQLQLLCRCSSMNSTGGEAMLRRAPLSIPIANGGGPRAMALQPEGGGCSGNLKLDSVDACLMTIGCRSHCSRALEQVIKPKMHGAGRHRGSQSRCRCRRRVDIDEAVGDTNPVSDREKKKGICDSSTTAINTVATSSQSAL